MDNFTNLLFDSIIKNDFLTVQITTINGLWGNEDGNPIGCAYQKEKLEVNLINSYHTEP